VSITPPTPVITKSKNRPTLVKTNNEATYPLCIARELGPNGKAFTLMAAHFRGECPPSCKVCPCDRASHHTGGRSCGMG